ncbi:uncharacterized protein VTP21DRAFT_7099 [Calcarisporiella thermophila]|uniref:uncharacterized protein n=1 Tax=Calcarisporiella thermophila TaxID=911321 RepID=UPI0037428AA2
MDDVWDSAYLITGIGAFLPLAFFLAMLLTFIDATFRHNKLFRKVVLKRLGIGIGLGIGSGIVMGAVLTALIVSNSFTQIKEDEGRGVATSVLLLIISVVFGAVSVLVNVIMKRCEEISVCLQYAQADYLVQNNPLKFHAFTVASSISVGLYSIYFAIDMAALAEYDKRTVLPIVVGLLICSILGVALCLISHYIHRIFIILIATAQLIFGAGFFASSLENIYTAIARESPPIIWFWNCCAVVDSPIWQLLYRLFGWSNPTTLLFLISYFCYLGIALIAALVGLYLFKLVQLRANISFLPAYKGIDSVQNNIHDFDIGKIEEVKDASKLEYLNG